MTQLTCIVPVYNEEIVADTVKKLKGVLEGLIDYEIIVVDDGSEKPVEVEAVTVLRHEKNKGYGAALKTGMLKAMGERILIIDSDDTYPVDVIPVLLEDGSDMVVGARTKANVQIPLYRKPAKWLLGKLANYLSRTNIPDLNSGLRVFKKEAAMEFLHLYPQGFSFTTTITLAFLCGDHTVRYIPIDYHVRKGKSKINPINDGLNFIMLIVRTIVYFNPLRVFLPISALMLLTAALIFIYTALILGRVMDITVIAILLSSVQVALFGLLAELIVKRAR